MYGDFPFVTLKQTCTNKPFCRYPEPVETSLLKFRGAVPRDVWSTKFANSSVNAAVLALSLVECSQFGRNG